MSYKRILVPVDGSPTATMGMVEAIKLAKEAHGKLMLLHIVEDHSAFVGPDAGASIAPMLEGLRQAGQRVLERIVRRVERAGIKPQGVLVESYGGRVADSIVEQAKRLRADLIVMGTHGRRGVSRVLLGSDADVVVRYSPVPVLLVPPRGRGKSHR